MQSHAAPQSGVSLEGVREFLAAPRCAVVSSVDSDGSPHQAVVHYWLVHDDLFINGRSDRRWLTNLRRDARVAVVVHDEDDPQHWVGIKGRVELHREGADATRDAMALAVRYGEDPENFAGQARVTLRIVARRVFEYG